MTHLLAEIHRPVFRYPQRFEADDWPPGVMLQGRGPEYWGNRVCGLACLRMLLDHFGYPVPTQFDLLVEALEDGAYTPAGWAHDGLARLGRRRGLTPEAKPLNLDQLVIELDARRPCIVSVTHQFPMDGRRGGHLVVVLGRRADPGPMVEFRDPSRWGATHRSVPEARFASSYTGRAIVFGAANRVHSDVVPGPVDLEVVAVPGLTPTLR